MITRACLIAPFLLSALPSSAQIKPLPPEHFYDETNPRFLTVQPQSFGKVLVVVRGPGGWRWFGDGEKTDKVMVFSQTIGEGQDRGTFFMAKGGESKWEIGFKPNQREPMDAGINGLYRRVSEEKRLQLARKEFQATEQMLEDNLKMVGRAAAGPDRAVLGDWKARWPALRDRWVALSNVTPAPTGAAPAAQPLPFGAKPQAPAHERQPDYWFAMAETAARGNGFVMQPIDKTAPVDWDGVYDDGFGGQVNIRTDLQGKLRVSLSFSRAGDQFTGALSGEVDPAKTVLNKDGAKVAEFSGKDVAMAEGAPPAVAEVRLTRAGRFLTIETKNAEKITGRGWFDGIYRWAPLPKE